MGCVTFFLDTGWIILEGSQVEVEEFFRMTNEGQCSPHFRSHRILWVIFFFFLKHCLESYLLNTSWALWHINIVRAEWKTACTFKYTALRLWNSIFFLNNFFQTKSIGLWKYCASSLVDSIWWVWPPKWWTATVFSTSICHWTLRRILRLINTVEWRIGADGHLLSHLLYYFVQIQQTCQPFLDIASFITAWAPYLTRHLLAWYLFL